MTTANAAGVLEQCLMLWVISCPAAPARASSSAWSLSWHAAQEIEATLMKRDEAKASMREKTDQPGAVAKALALNDAVAVRRRGKMMLPAPQARSLLAPLHRAGLSPSLGS